MATSKPEDPHGLIDLNARLPVADSPYGMAYGARTGTGVRPEAANIDEFLKDEPRPTRVAAARPVRVNAPADVAAPVAPAPTPAEPIASAPEQAPLLALAEPPAPSTTDDSSRYAERDSKSQSLEKFRGGDALVITSGALLIILLVIIIILLLR